ncbi:tyrosine-protein kinase, non-receptor Jak2 [Tanacetum coccineum]
MSSDGMDHLRIPFEKIKFGHKLEVQGYGTIYEGEFDGTKVALKQLNITNLVNVKPRLLAEILAISRFREHPNLVALLGFCDEKSNEIILVYEYVASGNLADKMRKRLNTIHRLEICLGAARGLDYLHTGVDVSIVHGNIKPSKILLNSNSTGFDAKVSSFGLSKVVPGQSRKNLEPVEPATKESDVYSFGVLLLEVLCGVSELVDTDDYQERHVSELVPKRLEQNKLRKVVHFDIRKEIKEPALETYAKIACECVNESPEARPTMARVVEELEKALILQDQLFDKGAEVVGEDKLDNVAREYNSDAIHILGTASETTTEDLSRDLESGPAGTSGIYQMKASRMSALGRRTANTFGIHLDRLKMLGFCEEKAMNNTCSSVDNSTPGIVHGHIKLFKILLNSDSKSSRFKAKVSGFGLSKLLPGDVQIAPRSTDLTCIDHDQEGDGTGETISSYIAEDDSKVTEETVDITARVSCPVWGIAAPNKMDSVLPGRS